MFEECRVFQKTYFFIAGIIGAMLRKHRGQEHAGKHRGQDPAGNRGADKWDHSRGVKPSRSGPESLNILFAGVDAAPP